MLMKVSITFVINHNIKTPFVENAISFSISLENSAMTNGISLIEIRIIPIPELLSKSPELSSSSPLYAGGPGFQFEFH